MSEKRYYVNCAGYLCDKDLSNTLSIFECADLLNQLTKENEQLQEEIKRLEKMIWKIQWRFQREVGIEKARKHYQEIDKEMNE